MERLARDGVPALNLDVTLLAGFEFACRPGCGLCCFTSPRVDGAEERQLGKLSPAAHFVSHGGERRIEARPDGGACQFLTQLKCAVHDARPAPCREFPISVHIGTRLQATVVLSCPGLRLDPFPQRDPGGTPTSFSGLDPEISSVLARLTPAVGRRLADSERRRRRIARELGEQGRWLEDEEVRRRLRSQPLIPRSGEYSPQEPPSAEDGLELLPMFYDGRKGPAALAQALGGWEALELSAEGGSEFIGLMVPPEQPPALDRGAHALLDAYLHYWLDRDAFLGAVHLEALSTPGGDVGEAALRDLHSIASDVLARASVRAKLRGDDGRQLGRADIELGIRATDQDWLDRPTWGSRL
ncbi:MAG TPA: YkgJ family cysteine cluster protein [Thermoplasmata archaeon]|nr:YkgJ family cysteine cluster protein [Thermoplasmata archaeon]